MPRRANYRVKSQGGKAIFTANTGRKMFINDKSGWGYKSAFGKVVFAGRLNRYLIRRKR